MVPRWLQDALIEIQLRVRPYHSCQRIWDSFTEAEKRKLGGNALVAYQRWGTEGMVCKWLGKDPNDERERLNAIVEAGYRLGVVTPQDRLCYLDALLRYPLQTAVRAETEAG